MDINHLNNVNSRPFLHKILTSSRHKYTIEKYWTCDIKNASLFFTFNVHSFTSASCILWNLPSDVYITVPTDNKFMSIWRTHETVKLAIFFTRHLKYDTFPTITVSFRKYSYSKYGPVGGLSGSYFSRKSMWLFSPGSSSAHS